MCLYIYIYIYHFLFFIIIIIIPNSCHCLPVVLISLFSRASSEPKTPQKASKIFHVPCNYIYIYIYSTCKWVFNIVIEGRHPTSLGTCTGPSKKKFFFPHVYAKKKKKKKNPTGPLTKKDPKKKTKKHHHHHGLIFFLVFFGFFWFLRPPLK